VFQFLIEQQVYLNISHIERIIKTPQHRAAAWLSREDHANLKVPAADADESVIYQYLVRYIMAVNFYALDAPNTWGSKLNFMARSNVCTWNGQVVSGKGLIPAGVFCDKVNSGVPDRLFLVSNKIMGAIPTENGLLTSLTHLDFSQNALTGTIPTNLCNLNQLRKLELSNNQFMGNIPPCIGTTLSNLEWLHLNHNMLEGSIPTHMAAMKQLQQLDIEENRLNGDPTPVWNSLSQLQLLQASHNNFTGVVGGLFCKGHRSLDKLDVSYNQFTYDTNAGGSFPHHLLTLFNLTHLDLSNNPLRGSFPKQLFPPKIPNKEMEYFSVHKTLMFGTFPDLHQLIMIKHLDLSTNNFNGALPSYFGDSNTRLEILHLSDNPQVTRGAIPSNFIQLSNLRELSLRGLKIEGTIPTYIGTNLSNLVLLDLGVNNFTNTVPANLANLKSLEYLLLNGNSNLGGELHSVTQHHEKLKLLLVGGTKIKPPTRLCPPFMISDSGANVSQLTVYFTCTKPTCECCKCCTPADGPRCSNEILTTVDESWMN
jgi:Leucine-rich repeat (LRR) protein